jgi:hypothetical protein
VKIFIVSARWRPTRDTKNASMLLFIYKKYISYNKISNWINYMRDIIEVITPKINLSSLYKTFFFSFFKIKSVSFGGTTCWCCTIHIINEQWRFNLNKQKRFFLCSLKFPSWGIKACYNDTCCGIPCFEYESDGLKSDKSKSISMREIILRFRNKQQK